MATYPNFWSGKEGVVHSWLAVHLGSPASNEDETRDEEHRVYCRAWNWWMFLCDRSLRRWLGTSVPMDKLTLAKERTDDGGGGGGGGRRVTMDHEGHDLQQKELHQALAQNEHQRMSSGMKFTRAPHSNDFFIRWGVESNAVVQQAHAIPKWSQTILKHRGDGLLISFISVSPWSIVLQKSQTRSAPSC